MGMLFRVRFLAVLISFLSLTETYSFASPASLSVSEKVAERSKVRQVAQLIDHRHPARVDGETKQCYLEIMDIKEQVEALAPKTPSPRIEPMH
jgi:hypothetical protein